MIFRGSAVGIVILLAFVGSSAKCLRAAAVTGWVKDTSFGGAGIITSGAATNSPILGNGTSNNAENVAIYAPMPLVTLTSGQRIMLTGSAEFIGSASVGDFRWGLFKDDGVSPAYGGWLGYMGSAETTVWSKNPTGTSFATSSFASIASSRGIVLGQMSEPLGNTFDAGTYSFSMSVDRFGSEVDVRVAIHNDVSGFSIVTSSYTESTASRLTFSFDRVGFLAGGALDADQVRFSGIDVATSTIVVPTLQVRADGMARIVNTFNETFDLTAYEITSIAGSLNDGWNGAGSGWFKAGGSSDNVLAQVTLSTASLSSGQGIYLGSAYTPGSTQDLKFRFTTAQGEVLRGLVQYVSFPNPVPGDVDGDGDVDGPDFAAWQTSFPKTAGALLGQGDADGDGDVDGADFIVWQTHFPMPAAPGSVPVPESTGWMIVLPALLAGLQCVRRKCGRGYPRPLKKAAVTLICLSIGMVFTPQARAVQINQVAGNMITFNTNGAWSWYMDERVIVDTVGGKLLMSSVTDQLGAGGVSRNGDVDVVSYDLNSGQIDRFTLHDSLQADDHNAAALLIRPDGRYLAMYTGHNLDNVSRYRISTNPHDATSWGAEQIFDFDLTSGADFSTTYSNLFYLPAENRTYNFVRANNRSPNMMLSANNGTSWSYGGKLTTSTNVGYVNGYFKYASNGVDRIDFIATEHHPRDFNTSIYHGYIKNGQMFQSNGTLLDSNIFDNSAPSPNSLTPVFIADPENGSQVYSRAWTTDLHVDSNGNPYGIFTVRANDVPVNSNGYNDHRFFYARYDGTQWNVHQLAKAGARLYPQEQDYTGLVALDPHDPNHLYMSSTYDPRDNARLAKHEIFEGITVDGGATWSWTPITWNSQVDNLRPIVPIWDANHTALVWLRGTYETQKNYDLEVVGLTQFGSLVGHILGDLNSDGNILLDDFQTFVQHMYTDLSALSTAEAYAFGDLNSDGKNDLYDFIIFRQSYDEANGPGAFDNAMAGVPEPHSAVLLLLAAAGFVLIRRKLARLPACQ